MFTGPRWGLLRWLSGKESACNSETARDLCLIFGSGRILGSGSPPPWRGKWSPAPVFLLEWNWTGRSDSVLMALGGENTFQREIVFQIPCNISSHEASLCIFLCVCVCLFHSSVFTVVITVCICNMCEHSICLQPSFCAHYSMKHWECENISQSGVAS